MLATPPPLRNISEIRVLGILYNVSKKKLAEPECLPLDNHFQHELKLAGNS